MKKTMMKLNKHRRISLYVCVFIFFSSSSVASFLLISPLNLIPCIAHECLSMHKRFFSRLDCSRLSHSPKRSVGGLIFFCLRLIFFVMLSQSFRSMVQYYRQHRRRGAAFLSVLRCINTHTHHI